MIKLFYFALVVALLLPCVFAAVVSIHSSRVEKEIQRNEQSRTSDSVYVIHKETTIGWGRFGISIYPRAWVGILVFAGISLLIIGLFVLFFVRL